MSTEFQKAFGVGKIEAGTRRTFRLNLHCTETRQQKEYTFQTSVSELQLTPGDIRLALMSGADTLIQAFLKGMSVFDPAASQGDNPVDG